MREKTANLNMSADLLLAREPVTSVSSAAFPETVVVRFPRADVESSDVHSELITGQKYPTARVPETNVRARALMPRARLALNRRRRTRHAVVGDDA
jgi:hypothetical protein